MGMTVAKARTWLIGASLGIVSANVVFFLLAPSLGYPLRSDQAERLMQITIPVFAGYLGSAVHFLFSAREPAVLRRAPHIAEQLGMLVRGPVVVFAIWVTAAVVSFGISNSSAVSEGSGMSVDTLAANLTAALALLTATTHAVVAYVFGAPPAE